MDRVHGGVSKPGGARAGAQGLALLVGVALFAIGVAGIFSPKLLLDLAGHFLSPIGILVAAAIRVIVGLLLVAASPGSRSPKVLRVFGIFLFLAGLVTPFTSVEQARAFDSWWAAHGGGVLRLWGFVPIVVGGFIVYALSTSRRTRYRPRP